MVVELRCEGGNIKKLHTRGCVGIVLRRIKDV